MKQIFNSNVSRPLHPSDFINTHPFIPYLWLVEKISRENIRRAIGRLATDSNDDGVLDLIGGTHKAISFRSQILRPGFIWIVWPCP